MSKSPGPLRALWLLLAVVLGVLPMASAVADDSNFRLPWFMQLLKQFGW